jgi:hypothetical protein
MLRGTATPQPAQVEVEAQTQAEAQAEAQAQAQARCVRTGCLGRRRLPRGWSPLAAGNSRSSRLPRATVAVAVAAQQPLVVARTQRAAATPTRQRTLSWRWRSAA